MRKPIPAPSGTPPPIVAPKDLAAAKGYGQTGGATSKPTKSHAEIAAEEEARKAGKNRGRDLRSRSAPGAPSTGGQGGPHGRTPPKDWILEAVAARQMAPGEAAIRLCARQGTLPAGLTLERALTHWRIMAEVPTGVEIPPELTELARKNGGIKPFIEAPLASTAKSSAPWVTVRYRMTQDPDIEDTKTGPADELLSWVTQLLETNCATTAEFDKGTILTLYYQDPASAHDPEIRRALGDPDGRGVAIRRLWVASEEKAQVLGCQYVKRGLKLDTRVLKPGKDLMVMAWPSRLKFGEYARPGTVEEENNAGAPVVVLCQTITSFATSRVLERKEMLTDAVPHSRMSPTPRLSSASHEEVQGSAAAVTPRTPRRR